MKSFCFFKNWNTILDSMHHGIFLEKCQTVFHCTFSCLDHTFPVHLFYQLYMQETGNLNITRSSAVNRSFPVLLLLKKCSFDKKKKLCVHKILFSYRKVSIRKQFDIKNVSPLARHFLCLTLQKTVFRSLPFHIWTQFKNK